MTTYLVPLDGVLGIIAKAADVDLDAAAELWRISLYEALSDLTERHGTFIDTTFAKAAAERTEATRRAIVRTYMSKRLTGDDVAALLEFAKTETADTRHDAQADQPRDERGRYEHLLDGRSVRGADLGGVGVAMDRVAAFTSTKDDKESGLSQFVRPGTAPQRRVYRQLKTTGNALVTAGLAHGNTSATLLGSAASLIGELGPEAERVLSPGIRRTAYRYRGTERRPDRRLQVQSRALNAKVDRLAKLERSDPQAAMELRKQYAKGHDALATVLDQDTRGKLSADQLRLRAQSALVGGMLADQIPSLESARLSLAAGQMPPSIGYIVDADGDVVSEAQGFNGDHYLPFDLKNLRRLHGGAYVRTRATGGPTDEDIYTALVTGARQLTVISHSGVFTVELDQDLRGGRRYSDKARSMVRRYSHLLSAVGSGEVYSRDMSPAQVAQEREKYYAKHPNLDAKTLADGFKTHLDNERARRRFRAMTPDEILAAADRQAQGEVDAKQLTTQGLARRRLDLQNEMTAKQEAETVRAYRLDGEGYKAALDALNSEFPFFIRDVDVQTLPEWLAGQGRPVKDMRPYSGTDLGRTESGALVPNKARAAGREPKDADATAADADKDKAKTAGTAAAAAAGAKGAAGYPWVEDGTRTLQAAYKDSNSDFAREFGYTLKKVLLLTRDPGVKDLFNVEASGANEENAEKHADAFAAWAQGQQGGDVAAWLLARPSRLDVAQQMAKDLSAAFADTEGSPLPQFQQQLEAATALARPFTKASGDPVLTEPEDGRPVEFPEITALGDRMGNYGRYLDANDEVRDATAQLSKVEPDQRADDIARQVSEYKALERWGKAGFADEERGRAPEERRDDAQSIVEFGEKSEPYRQLASLQKAFAFLDQRQTLATISGKEIPAETQEREADPKVTPPPAEPEEPVAKRGSSRVVVHRAGSPVAKAWAASTRSRRRPSTGNGWPPPR